MYQFKPSRLAPESTLTLRFAPLAWLKLLWFCHAGNTEVGGFGISSRGDLLYIEDFVPVRQQVTSVSVRFDDAAVADFFDSQVDQGIRPERFGEVWIHTHPGASPQPSGTDEDTFGRCFGGCDWSVMFILDQVGQTYARLNFSAGPGGQVLLPARAAWENWPFDLHDIPNFNQVVERWWKEYESNIFPERPVIASKPLAIESKPSEALTLRESDDPWWDREPWHEELDGVFYEPTHQGELHEAPA